jgi:hypothetical protein
MEAAVKFGFGPSPFCSAKNLTQDERERDREREREREEEKEEKEEKKI